MEPPRKRAKLSPPSSASTTTTPVNFTTNAKEGQVVKMDERPNKHHGSGVSEEAQREAEVGVLHYVDAKSQGFVAVFKQRYTDFQVFEIMPDGTHVHLTDDRAPKVKAAVEDPEPAAASTSSQIGREHENAGSTSVLNAQVTETEHKSDPRNDNSSTVRAEDSEKAFPETKEDPKNESSKPQETADANETSTIAQLPTNDENSKPKAAISADDDSLLTSYFGEEIKRKVIALYESILAKPNAKPSAFEALYSEPITDRALRGRLHANVRRIFDSRLETVSSAKGVADGVITISAAPPVKAHPEAQYARSKPSRSAQPFQPKGKVGWDQLGGPQLHFSLYKENKDTMEVVSFLAKALKINTKEFSYAGTKDRRAVTVQRVSVFRQHADKLARLNRDLWGARLGNFKHEKNRLELGELDGNHFVVTLRDCQFSSEAELDDQSRLVMANEVVSTAVENLEANGFINYFGLQRFGTFGIGTHEMGKKILKGDFKGAVDDLLTVTETSKAAALDPAAVTDRIGRDDIARATAIGLFRSTGSGHQAGMKMPGKFSGEKAVIRHLGSKDKGEDYEGAILTIQRNLRLMYVHAYQSYVWNFVASERWTRYGSKIIAGDLVIVDVQAEKSVEYQDEVDESGEPIIRPAADDFAVTRDDLFERARPLTKEEAQSGKYSVFDIVLPTPGFDIEYPSNDIGDFYKEFMASERGGGLDPANMRRKNKDFSLSGSYRKLMSRVKDLKFEVKNYFEMDEQLIETDLEKLEKSRSQNNHQNGHRDQRNLYNDRGRGRGRGQDRGRGRGRGGRRDHEWWDNQRNDRGSQQQNGSRMYSDVRLEEEQNPETTDATPPVNAQLAAWQNFSSTEEKTNLENTTEATSINAENAIKPIYQDTFIEKSEDGGKTGVRRTINVGADGQEVSDEVAKAAKEADAAQFEADTLARNAAAAARKRPVEEILSASTTVAPTTSAVGQSEVEKQDVKMEDVHSSSVVSKSTTDQETNDLATDDLNPDSVPPKPKIAVIIAFSLGTSQYATMALRELMKEGGVRAYKPDFSSGR